MRTFYSSMIILVKWIMHSVLLSLLLLRVIEWVYQQAWYSYFRATGTVGSSYGNVGLNIYLVDNPQQSATIRNNELQATSSISILSLLLCRSGRCIRRAIVFVVIIEGFASASSSSLWSESHRYWKNNSVLEHTLLQLSQGRIWQCIFQW